jgi:uncharacterized protein YbcI
MDAEHSEGSALAAISNGLMHLHMRYYGRGPTKAKTHFVDDTVLCVLWDSFTTVEETLIRQGERVAVEDFRRTFHGAMEEEFKKVVEEATGRSVKAYMSQVHVDPNVAVELFLLDSKA